MPTVGPHKSLRDSCKKCDDVHTMSEHQSHGLNSYCNEHDEKSCNVSQSKQYYINKYGFSKTMNLAQMQAIVSVAQKKPDGVGMKNLREREERMNQLRQDQKDIDATVDRYRARGGDKEAKATQEKDYENFKKKHQSKEETEKRDQQAKRIKEMGDASAHWKETDEQYKARLAKMRKD